MSKHLYVAVSVALVIYGIHKIYELEVNQEDFAINHRLKVEANSAQFFRFLTQEHVMEKRMVLWGWKGIGSGDARGSPQKYKQMATALRQLNGCSHYGPVDGVTDGGSYAVLQSMLLPWLTRFKEADARVLSVGKFYRAFLKLPILGIGRIHLMVVEYRPTKLLVLESGDSITKQRVEIRTKRYHDRTILHTTVYLRKTSALYHYTVGLALRYYIQRHLEKSSSTVAEVYKAVEERRRLTDMY